MSDPILFDMVRATPPLAAEILLTQADDPEVVRLISECGDTRRYICNIVQALALTRLFTNCTWGQYAVSDFFGETHLHGKSVNRTSHTIE